MALTNPDDYFNDETFASALKNNPISFGFDNGRVKDVCLSSKDELWVVNVKKGIMSSFQHSVSEFGKSLNVTETDVVGRCNTQYKFYNSRWGQKYHKIKDMYSCSGNQALYQYALNLPDINLQHLPLIR